MEAVLIRPDLESVLPSIVLETLSPKSAEQIFHNLRSANMEITLEENKTYLELLVAERILRKVGEKPGLLTRIFTFRVRYEEFENPYYGLKRSLISSHPEQDQMIKTAYLAQRMLKEAKQYVD